MGEIARQTVSRGQQAGQQADAEPRRSRGPARWVALGIVIVAAAGLVSAWRSGVLSPAAGGAQEAPATAVVTRQDLSAVMPVTAMLGYAGSYPVAGRGGGTLTWLPSAGQVVRQGQPRYRTGNGSPVVLMYGSVPDWRALAPGITGQDVTQLNHDLVDLGYASRANAVAPGWDYYSWDTASAVQRLEEQLGVASPAGSLAWGQVVFEPEALRVSQVTGSLGGPAGGPVLTATSDRHAVTIPLGASDQSEVKAGDPVTVTLPDGSTTPGVVAEVGVVATTTPGPQGNPATTIPVQVTLADPAAAGTLDQAPVTVNIITASATNVLAVPVLLSLAGGTAGVAIGAAATAAYARGHGESVIIPPEAWAGGLAAAVVIGALAGLLPAIRAARMSPTQALLTA